MGVVREVVGVLLFNHLGEVLCVETESVVLPRFEGALQVAVATGEMECIHFDNWKGFVMARG
jgi:hypothetical protein